MFYKENSKLIEEHNFIEVQILNMDESAFYLDAPCKFCIKINLHILFDLFLIDFNL